MNKKKKTPAQLDREINEALTTPQGTERIDFAAYQKAHAALNPGSGYSLGYSPASVTLERDGTVSIIVRGGVVRDDPVAAANGRRLTEEMLTKVGLAVNWTSSRGGTLRSQR